MIIIHAHIIKPNQIRVENPITSRVEMEWGGFKRANTVQISSLNKKTHFETAVFKVSEQIQMIFNKKLQLKLRYILLRFTNEN